MARKMRPVLGMLCAVWVTAHAVIVETPRNVLRAAWGNSVTLPCTYHTSASNRDGFVQWDKLLRSHSEMVLIWKFLTKTLISGELYKDRVNVSGNAEISDASVTIGQLTMEDNGTYECSVSLMEDLGGTPKSRVQLLVFVLPSKPECGIEGETIIGNNIQLTCQSKEGSPAPQYSWRTYDILNQERPAPPASMNVALYAGIAGGLAAAIIVVGIVVYCCCCRGKDEAKVTRQNRVAYQKPPEQLRELQTGREEEDDYRQEDEWSYGRESPGHADW
ncbi:cell surface A33 antigen isoform X2 [Acinonyx jubatus]|uniref:Cell surface A33 antigen isoform X2 n=1 Tax=Acinonyx jubatus TaxID=32536 RepID=A0ABM3P0D1_ACIJB|nr:cell surface A33 antigen isoform X2 [Acinonyx jubatus]